MRKQLDEYRLGVRAAAGIIALLVALCVLASLSGCLTAPKLLKWQMAVYGWATGKDASAGCVEASGTASAYLTEANKRLQTARAATDLESDSTARALMTAAAKACGRSMP